MLIMKNSKTKSFTKFRPQREKQLKSKIVLLQFLELDSISL